MKQGEKLLRNIQEHFIDTIDTCAEMVDKGIVNEGEWKFDFITIVCGRRIDKEATEHTRVSFQRMMYSHDNCANLIGVLELSKAEIIHNTLNGDES